MARRKRGFYLNNFVDAGKFGPGGRLDLFIACVNDKTRPTVAKLRELGFSKEAQSIESAAKKIAAQEVRSLTQDALKTAQRHVPIDSRELQKEHIRVEYTTDQNGYPEGYVYVDGDAHYGSRRKRPEKASYLAEYLNSPDRRLARSEANGPHAKNSPTRRWINDAKRDFRERKQAIIRREI